MGSQWDSQSLRRLGHCRDQCLVEPLLAGSCKGRSLHTDQGGEQERCDFSKNSLCPEGVRSVFRFRRFQVISLYIALYHIHLYKNSIQPGKMTDQMQLEPVKTISLEGKRKSTQTNKEWKSAEALRIFWSRPLLRNNSVHPRRVRKSCLREDPATTRPRHKITSNQTSQQKCKAAWPPASNGPNPTTAKTGNV